MKKIRHIILLYLIVILGACSESQSDQEKKEDIENLAQPVELIGAHEVSNEISDFVGVWTGTDNYPMVEISHKDGKFHVRECYGLDAEKGTYYTAILKDGILVAEGNEDDFYKGTLPTYELMENGQLNQNSGVGPIDLNESKLVMPNIEYAAPVNND